MLKAKENAGNAATPGGSPEVSSLRRGLPMLEYSAESYPVPGTPPNPPSAQKMQKRYVLHGLGGSGKTQICLKFAQDHRERYDNTCLIPNIWDSLPNLGFPINAFLRDSLF